MVAREAPDRETGAHRAASRRADLVLAPSMSHDRGMGTASRWELVSEADYVDAERSASVKHEYVEGIVYAMAGGSVAHNLIASNVLVALGSALRGKPCRAFNSDMRVRVRLPEGTRYYYPDAMVVCRSNPADDAYQDEPAVLVEVLGDATRRIDEDEKRRAYFAIPSLTTLVHLEQDARVAVVYARGPGGFTRSVVEASGRIALPSIDVELELEALYDGLDAL